MQWVLHACIVIKPIEVMGVFECVDVSAEVVNFCLCLDRGGKGLR